MTHFAPADRLNQLPPYLFAEIDRLRAAQEEKGVEVIDMSIGDPDLATPPHLLAKMREAIENTSYHSYPSYTGMLRYREAIARWYERRFGVTGLDPKAEILALIGSKEGIGHLPWAFLNPGEGVLYTQPGYPVYRAATILAAGTPHPVPLLRQNDFLPDLEAIPPDIAKKARLFFFNYPNNPTAATADLDFYQRIVEFGHKYNILLCHDAAYSEISFDGYKAPSFLQVEGAKEIGLEFHSLSKTYNMTGWRIGWAAGNASAIAALGKIKTNVDSGAFEAIQETAIEAFQSDDSIHETCQIYRERREMLVSGLRKLSLEAENPRATFYVWTPTPPGVSSQEFATQLLTRVGVVCTPGNGFGPDGEGFVRFSLTTPTPLIEEAVRRIKTNLDELKNL